TYSPTLPTPGGAWWYRVVVGAFPDSASAESTLVAWRVRGAIRANFGSAIQTPRALLVADSITETEAGARVTELRSRNVPAYALRVVPGWARVYVGTFDSDSAARTVLATLDSLNLRATLVPRVGSVF
ncbi:MAG: SPOR domain-containing protein, partial [Gemmatimonadaceae bacterium]